MNYVRLLFALVFISNSVAVILVDPSTNQFLDEQGRTRMFHGVNVVEKDSPYYPTSLLTPERMDLLAELGFNVVRLVSIQSDDYNKQNSQIIILGLHVDWL